MNNKRTYSIYPNTRTRVAVHVLYWIVFFFFDLVDIKYSWVKETSINFFSPQSVITSLSETVLQIVSFYYFFTAVYPLILKRKWLLVLPNFFVLYFILYSVNMLMLRLVIHSAYSQPDMVKSYNDYFINYKGFFRFVVFMTFFKAVFWKFLPSIIIKVLVDFYESQKEKLAIIQERNTMELNLIRTQLNPKFLFDTLNNIYGLLLENEAASRTVLQLSDLMRFALYDSSKGDITLEAEKEFLINYILLEKMRHKESRVHIDYNFENIENNTLQMKPLILVNFIENAFKHSVNATIADARVHIKLEEKDNNLLFQVSNNKPLQNKTGSGGVGLRNVRRRLDLEYPNRYELTVKETDTVYETTLTIAL